MRKFYFAFFFLPLFNSSAIAQLDVSIGFTATELAATMAGDGIQVINITSDCFAQAFGKFNCIDCNLGIDSGIVMTSGKAILAEGPNNSEGTGFDNGWSDDADLEDLPGVSAIFDGCVLEFDIIPNFDTVKFQYVFGSDEYVEFVDFANDAFAFWISGPGILGEENIALIPGTSIPVTINNLNNIDYSIYYHNNPSSGAALTDPYYIEYDGFTTVLEAVHEVIPCDTFHLKLAIGDQFDHLWDSGVFLKAKSLTTDHLATFDYPSAGGGGSAEYCTTGTDPAPALDSAATSGTWSATPAGLVINSTSGLIDLSASVPGTYTVTNEVIYGFCEFDTITASFTVIINAPPIATFSYSGSPYCPYATDPAPILAAGAETGTFTAAPTGCVINALTGIIDVSASSEGTYTITNTIPASGGCPAVTATTIITIIESYIIAVTTSICSGDSYTLPGGSLVSTAGVYVDSLSSSGGCDSVITTTLSINPVYAFDQEQNICDGDIYILPDGAAASAAGTYISNLFSSAGCDSIITTLITVTPLSFASVNAEICSGEFYFFADGSSTISAGVYNTIIPAASGCDSTITTTLTVHPVFSIPQSVDICTGSTYILPDGSVAPGAGTYYSNFTSLFGCDSVIVTTVNELDVINATVNAAICAGENYILPDGSSVTASGTYVQNYFTVSGCDSVITTNLTVQANPVIDFSPDAVICIEAGNYILNATPAGGYYTGDHVAGDAFSTTGAGVGGPYAITYYFTDANGCSDTATAYINVDANFAEAFGDTSIIGGDTAFIYGNTGGTYSWIPEMYLNCPTCPQAVATPLQNIVYTLTSVNDNGCIASDAVNIYVMPDPGEYIFIPNAFSPNGDHVNDNFFAYGPNLLSIASMRIYDRWGALLFEREDIPASDSSLGWDGSAKGLVANSGVYAYTMQLIFDDGESQFVKGNITLMK